MFNLFSLALTQKIKNQFFRWERRQPACNRAERDKAVCSKRAWNLTQFRSLRERAGRLPALPAVSVKLLLAAALFLTFFGGEILAQTPAQTPPNPPQQTVPQPRTPEQPTQQQPTQQSPTQQQNQPTVQPNAQPQTATPNSAPPVSGVQQTPGQNVGVPAGIAPANLPADPPPVAPNFEAPNRPLPSAERVGVDVTNQLPLTLEEAIRLALENNNDIDSSRINVQIAEFNLTAARGVYDPVISNESYYERRTTPTASVIGGAGASGSVTQSDFTSRFGFGGFSPFAGGAYSVDFANTRLTTSNLNATLNPQFPTALTATYTQPLWRGLRFDNNRRQIEIAKKNLSLTDAQFRQRAIDTISQVEQSYWDLVFALRNLQVQIDAVKQARTQLESNQRLVAKGALAPIEIVAATTQVTTFEQNVYTAQESVTRAENILKTLMLKERTSEIWGRSLTPVTPVEIEAPRTGLQEAVSEALKNRPELAQLQTSAEINQINERFYRDQTKPQIDLVGSYTAAGLAGAVNTARPNNNPPANLVGGYLNSLGNLIGQDFPTFRVGVNISLPLKNRTAEANLGRSLAEGSQIKNQRLQAEQIIEADVRNSLQALRSAEARLQSAAAARSSSEQQYESEQRQFRAGTTTVYLVLQRQTELLAARGRELQAQTDLNKAISGFQRATGTTLTANNVSINDGTNAPKFSFRATTAFNANLLKNTQQEAKKTEVLEEEKPGLNK